MGHRGVARTLKTGGQIEERQLGLVARLENGLAIDLVVAWRIYYLTLLERMDPDAPCTLFFQDPGMEGAVYLVSPHHRLARNATHPVSVKVVVPSGVPQPGPGRRPVGGLRVRGDPALITATGVLGQ